MHESDIDHRADRWLRRDTAIGPAGVAAALPPGWICLQDCDISGIPGQAVPLHYVLLHADIGAAMLDIAPAATQGAEATLRRRLDAARFEGIFPGHLPVVHLRIAADEARGLATLLDQAFATLPPLSLAGGDAWISVVRRALSPRDPGRGAAYRSMHADDWPTPPTPTPRPASGRPDPDDALDGTAAAGAWSDDADPRESFLAEDPPRRRRSPWVSAALGTASLVAISALVAVAMSGGGANVETAPPQVAVVAPRGNEATGAAAAGAPVIGDPATGTRTAGTAALAAIADPALAPRPSARGEAPVVRETLPARAAAPTLAPVPAANLGGANGAPRAAETQVAPPPAGSARVVVASAVNLRAGPAKSFAVLRTAPRGEGFRVHARAPGNWVQVGEAEPEGWAFGDLLREVRP